MLWHTTGLRGTLGRTCTQNNRSDGGISGQSASSLTSAKGLRKHVRKGTLSPVEKALWLDKSQKSHSEISRIVLTVQGSTDRQSEVSGGEFHSIVMGQGGQRDQPSLFVTQVPRLPMARLEFRES